MRLIVPGLRSASVVRVSRAAGATPVAAPAVVPTILPADEAFGKPFSQLPKDEQRSLLANVPSSAGGLSVGPETGSEQA